MRPVLLFFLKTALFLELALTNRGGGSVVQCLLDITIFKHCEGEILNE